MWAEALRAEVDAYAAAFTAEWPAGAAV